jgi:hypothetical protein
VLEINQSPVCLQKQDMPIAISLISMFWKQLFFYSDILLIHLVFSKFWTQIICSRTFLVYLFITFAHISYGRFIAMHYKFNLSTYVQEPLVVDRRGCVQREI